MISKFVPLRPLPFRSVTGFGVEKVFYSEILTHWRLGMETCDFYLVFDKFLVIFTIALTEILNSSLNWQLFAKEKIF